MKNLNPSIYTFENFLLGDYLYVDKTEYLWQLVSERKGIYFLSRPRRFGKSLTVSTLEAIFQGRRELFKGLAIDGKEYDWKAYPIIHFNFADCAVGDEDGFKDYLATQVRYAAEDAKVPMEADPRNPAKSFEELVRKLYGRGPVVILVDEYDKPLLNNLGDMSLAHRLLPIMKGFYSVIKKCESMERFVFVTGVTKFCHVSLFSDLNNLLDISTHSRFATMLGYTQEELEANFAEHLSAAEDALHLERAELLRRLKFWYDGYRFAPDAATVYNPVSIANFFMNGGRFENYWYATGTTSALFKLMRRDNATLPELMERPVSGSLFESFDLEAVDIQKLMYQTGYLTIGKTEILDAGTEYAERIYHLRFPNFEVNSSFNEHVLEHYAGMRGGQSMDATIQLRADIRNGDVDAFMKRLQTLFAKIPYNLHGRQERDYQTILFVIFMMLNVTIEGEYHTNDGRIDLVLSTDTTTFVIELKLNKTARKAMAQIEHKDYARGFLGQGRRVVAVGVNFNSRKAQIDSWLVEEIPE